MYDNESHIPPKNYGHDISIIEAINIILKNKRTIGIIVTTATTAAVVLNLLLPNVYTSKATLLPIENNQTPNLSALFGNMGGGLGSLATQAGIGFGGSTDKLSAILHSRSLTEAVIQKNNLTPLIFQGVWDQKSKKWRLPWLQWTKPSSGPSLQEATQKLQKHLKITLDTQKNTISIAYTSKDPELSALVANAYTNELESYINNNTISIAKQNRIFIENQLKSTQQDLFHHEETLKKFQQEHKLLSLSTQSEAAVKTYSELKARLISAEIELVLLEKSTPLGDQRSAIKRQEISELKNQLSKFENGSERGPSLTFNKAPSLGLEFARIKRDLMVRERVFELLTQQYEMARIQEAKEDLSFQVLDEAIPPEKKSGPKRATNIIIALFTSLILAIGFTFTMEFWSRNRTLIQN